MRTIKSNIRVRLKIPTIEDTNGIGTVMHDVIGDGLAYVMLDAGVTTYTGREIAVLTDQSPGPAPMRDRLPYGRWTCAEGREVLFDRDCQAIWTRRPGEPAVAADRANSSRRTGKTGSGQTALCAGQQAELGAGEAVLADRQATD